MFGLNERQLEVAELVAQGLSNKEIGERVYISENAVKARLTEVYKKLGIDSESMRVKLAIYFMKNLPPPKPINDGVLPQGLKG